MKEVLNEASRKIGQMKSESGKTEDYVPIALDGDAFDSNQIWVTLIIDAVIISHVTATTITFLP